MDCGDCFFSELVDGTLHCNHFTEDMQLKRDNGAIGLCKDFVNVYRVREILDYYNRFLSEHIDEKLVLDCFDEFNFENRQILGM